MRYGGFGIIPSRESSQNDVFWLATPRFIPMLLWSIITDPFKTAMACCVPYLGADSCAPSMVSSFQGTRLSIWATFWRLKAEQMECVKEVLTHHGKIQFHSNRATRALLRGFSVTLALAPRRSPLKWLVSTGPMGLQRPYVSAKGHPSPKWTKNCMQRGEAGAKGFVSTSLNSWG